MKALQKALASLATLGGGPSNLVGHFGHYSKPARKRSSSSQKKLTPLVQSPLEQPLCSPHWGSVALSPSQPALNERHFVQRKVSTIIRDLN